MTCEVSCDYANSLLSQLEAAERLAESRAVMVDQHEAGMREAEAAIDAANDRVSALGVDLKLAQSRIDTLLAVIKDCSVLCWMAYSGNAGERQALRMIRSNLEPFTRASEE